MLEAGGFTLAETLYAPVDTPPFDQSAMDGYAFAFDSWDGSSSLQVIGELQAGGSSATELRPGQAMRIFTGAPMPAGSDTVVIQEKVRSSGNEITILDDKLVRYSNVRPAGSQTKKGGLLLEDGQWLGPAAVSFLASTGISRVMVYSKPTVSIIITGNELVEPGGLAAEGMVYESNSAGLIAVLQQMGIAPVSVQQVKDDQGPIRQAISKALSSDLIIITGGISTGDYDLVKPALESLSVQEVFHFVQQKPGKPFYFGVAGETLVFALPGNPVAALTCFYEYIAPAICRQTRQDHFKKIVLPLSAGHKKKPGMTHFLKGRIEQGRVTILKDQESYKMNTFALADCLVELEAEKETFEPGELVIITLIH